MRTFYFIFLLAILSNELFAQPASSQKTVIKNVNVISIDPSKPQIMPAQDVFVTDGKIQKIRATSSGKNKGYNIVDGTNKYLVPGMADMHVHLPTKSAVIQTREFYLLNLLNGFTTVRQMRGKAADLVVRDSIRKGLWPGCNTYVSTPFFRDNEHFSAASCKDSLTRYKQQGYDFVKYLYGLKPLEFDTLVATAASLNMVVVGHAPGNDLEKAVSANEHSIEHIDPFVVLYQKDSLLFWKTIDKMVEKHLFHCPNLEWYIITGSQNPLDKKRNVYEQNAYGIGFMPEDTLDYLINEEADNYIKAYKKNPVGFAKGIIKLEEDITVYKSLLGKMHRKGVNLLISATSGNYIIPGYHCIDEMELFVAAGISPYETIKCATYNAADCLNETAKWGTITEGKQADMVLLSANPLDDIKNLRKIESTIINGSFFTHDYLLGELKKYYPATVSAMKRK